MPWYIGYDRLEEDWVYRLHSSMKLHAAKILAREMRDAVWEAHETALGGKISKAVPFDLNALSLVPVEVLRLGSDHHTAMAWMWEYWGTTWSLRRSETVKDEAGVWTVQFCSADWTSWTLLTRLKTKYSLHISVKVFY